jgi:hypothetical protein
MEKIICWIKGHNLESVESKIVTGILFGQSCEAHRYVCQRCGKDTGWAVTETLSI